jgi:Viral BACON domain
LTRKLLLPLLLLVLSLPALAQQTCQLEMTATCTPDGDCTSTTTNSGRNTCSGEYFVGFFVDASAADARLNGYSNSLGLAECFNSADFPEGTFPQPFALCFGNASLRPGASFEQSVRISGASSNVPVIGLTFVADPETGDERGGAFAYANVDIPSCKPRISAPPVAQSGVDYTISWSTVVDPAASFVIEESTSPDFTANLVSSTVSGLSKTFRHDSGGGTAYYYRVRPANCTGGTPQFSEVAQTIVQAAPPIVRESGDAAVPIGSTTPVRFTVFIPGSGSGTGILADSTFTATTDQPFLTVTPSSGTLPPEGTTVTVTANPTGLQPGANTGSLKVTANGSTTSIPISISLVTPVQPGTKTTPPGNALVIPVVTHVQGAAGPFLSDVRLTNASPNTIKYQISMTPTETDGTKFSKITEVSVESQQTIALNDVVKNFFGYGVTGNPGDFGFGALELRPLNTSSNQTFASSRTYASTTAGTFGQFIAAVPFSNFASQGGGLPIPGEPGETPVLSLQQVAQSSKFRTNLGLVEGAGQPANGRIRVFDDFGTLLKELSYELQPGEHKQMNRFIELQAGISNLADGRIEVTVDSDTGAVTAYASVLDNVTTDPLAVMPVEASKVSATRYVLPGIAELPGENNFHSDIRVYNGGAGPMPATFTYYPFNNLPPVNGGSRTIGPGQVLAIDNVLREMFNHSGTGGSIVITTPSESSLVATARTYTNVVNNGTYGQFIPGVTPEEGIGLGDQPLEVLQLEESDHFRSNLGLAELTGNPVDLRISVHFPDTKVTASTNVTLAANEFRQYNRIVGLFTEAGKQTYNARVTVEVIGGTGRVTAYGSVIDNKSKDPTYVPAQ